MCGVNVHHPGQNLRHPDKVIRCSFCVSNVFIMCIILGRTCVTRTGRWKRSLFWKIWSDCSRCPKFALQCRRLGRNRRMEVQKTVGCGVPGPYLLHYILILQIWVCSMNDHCFKSVLQKVNALKNEILQLSKEMVHAYESFSRPASSSSCHFLFSSFSCITSYQVMQMSWDSFLSRLYTSFFFAMFFLLLLLTCRSSSYVIA